MSELENPRRPEASGPPPCPAPRRAAWRRLRGNWAALGALAVLASLVLSALAAPLLAPESFEHQFRGAEKAPPLTSLAGKNNEAGRHFFLLGTDHHGRDVLSRIMYGARVSLLVGIVATLINLLLGVLVGLLGGYFGGWLDAVFMRITDTIFAFPSVLLAVAITAVFDRPSLWVVFLALGLVGWTSLARVVRSQVLAVRTLDYVRAAEALGAGHTRLLWRHILPNCLSPILVMATLSVGWNILGEAGLSFLGLGVQEPYPSWGGMLAEASEQYQAAWWLAVFPGLMIVLTVLSFNLLGDRLNGSGQ